MKIRDILGKIKTLPVNKRVQLIGAVFVSFVLVISVPVAAWFGNQRRIMKLQKIQTPNTLVLSAANRKAQINFEINGIDASEDQLYFDGTDNTEQSDPKPITKTMNKAGSASEKEKIDHKDYVFCVTGKSVNEFTIQLAHTTNVPFTYEIYDATEYGSFAELMSSGDAPVQDQKINYTEFQITTDTEKAEGLPSVSGVTDYTGNKTLYYTINKSCISNGIVTQGTGKYDLQPLNEQGSTGKAKTNDKYFKETYDIGNNTAYSYWQQDAVPLYSQVTGVQAIPGEDNSNKLAFSRNFILRVSWEDVTDLSVYEKETDMVYLSVRVTS